MSKEKLFMVLTAITVLWVLYAEGWIGEVVFISVYAIGRLVAKMAYRKAKDPTAVLYYLSVVCMVLSIMVGIILGAIADKGLYVTIIMLAWLSSTIWRINTVKTK